MSAAMRKNHQNGISLVKLRLTELDISSSDAARLVSAVINDDHHKGHSPSNHLSRK